MGSKFLTRFFVVWSLLAFSSPARCSDSEIVLPEEPVPDKVENPNFDSYMQGLKAREKIIPKSESLEASASEPEPEKPLPPNYDFKFSTGLRYTLVEAHGSRKNYTSTLGGQLMFLFNLESPKPYGEWKWWLGGYLTGISGFGVHQKIPGHYGFLYFGPIVSLGRILLNGPDFPAVTDKETETKGTDEGKDGKEKKEVKAPQAQEPLPSGYAAFFFHMGILLQTRLGETNEGYAKSSDFRSKSLNFDIPGLWCEGEFSYFLEDSLSVDGFLGGQIGDEKIFFWMGVGVSGWI